MTQPQSVWDDPALKPDGDFVKFENVGDSVSGVINSIRTHHWPDGTAAPQVSITTDDGEDRTLTASQVQLKALLYAQKPQAGDHLAVKLTQIEKRAGNKTLKHFDVDVTRGKAIPALRQDDLHKNNTVGKQGFSDDPPPF